MKRFGDFLFVSEEELSKNKDQKTNQEDRVAKAKSTLEKAKLSLGGMQKEKLAGPGEFMADPKNEAAGVRKQDALVPAQTSPGQGGATGKSMDQSTKACGYTMKDDAPHAKDSPEDKAHDVVEEDENVADAADQVKGDPKKMFEHLRSYREMKDMSQQHDWKRSPDNAEVGKSGIADPMLMSLHQQKNIKKSESAEDLIKADPSKQPPKEWWDKKYAEVKAGNPSYSEEQVRATVGSIWYHEMSGGQKASRRKAEGKRYGEAKKSKGPQSFNQMKKEDARKNDPAVSGTKVESPASGELGNKAKPDAKSLEPLKCEPKQKMGEPVGDHYARKSMAKSMKDGGALEWTQQDVARGLAFSADGRVGATEGPNLSAQPLINREAPKTENSREIPLDRVLDDMDDSKVTT